MAPHAVDIKPSFGSKVVMRRKQPGAALRSGQIGGGQFPTTVA
jgi:hypothetical protein